MGKDGGGATQGTRGCGRHARANGQSSSVADYLCDAGLLSSLSNPAMSYAEYRVEYVASNAAGALGGRARRWMLDDGSI